MKRKLFFAGFLVLMCGFSSVSFHWLGLDDDSQTEIDSALETKQQDEEFGFTQVANLIATFVRHQYQRRQLPTNLVVAGTRAYKDLPKPVYATRDVHRKSHGCYQAKFFTAKNFADSWNKTSAAPIRVADDLGIFKPGSEYDAVVRFSNGNPQNRDDSLPDARGFAVKLLPPGILTEGTWSSKQNAGELNSATVLDILSINFPTFFVNQQNTALKYYEINHDFLPGALDFKNSLVSKLAEGQSVFTTGVNALEANLALAVNGSVIKSPLFQEYFSMVPSRLGMPGTHRAVKYIWTPSACDPSDSNFEVAKKSEWPEWTNERDYSNPIHPLSNARIPPNLFSSKDGKTDLRRKVIERLSKGSHCFTLYLQPYLDPVSTNIEDSTDIWFRSEQERTWWIQKIVPSALSPLNHLLKFDRAAYMDKVKIQKKVSAPIPVAKLEISQLNGGIHPVDTKMCEDLSFNPWNGDIVHHKPLGVINRLKRRVYNASRRTRHLLNGLQRFMPERKSPIQAP